MSRERQCASFMSPHGYCRLTCSGDQDYIHSACCRPEGALEACLEGSKDERGTPGRRRAVATMACALVLLSVHRVTGRSASRRSALCPHRRGHREREARKACPAPEQKTRALKHARRSA